jgi:hypothetical protein
MKTTQHGQSTSQTKKPESRTSVQSRSGRFQLFLLPGHRRQLFKGQGAEVSRWGDVVIVREKQGVAISLFQLSEDIARDCRETGKPIDEETRQWIEVPEWTTERERKEIHSFLRPHEDPFQAARLGCRVELCGSIGAAMALGSMAEECLRHLQHAADDASNSDLTSAHASIALEQLVRVLASACAELNDLARKRPRLFHRFSRKLWKWPVMKSTYPGFGDDEPALFAGLQLGQDLPLRLDRKAQWAKAINDDAGRIAWQLLWYVWLARSENNRIGFNYGPFSAKADALPALDKKSASLWWKVAKEALLLCYPKPLEVSELTALVTKRKDRFPSRRAEAILAKLESRFLSLAKLPITSPT